MAGMSTNQDEPTDEPTAPRPDPRPQEPSVPDELSEPDQDALIEESPLQPPDS
jgi:hypothetical protein